MIKRKSLIYFRILLFPILFLGVITLVTASVFAATDPTAEVCRQNPSSPICKTSADPDGNPVVKYINIAAAIVAIIAGIAAVIMLILGGLSYVTSGGNAEQAASARRRITYSIVGIVVIALAWTITSFITDRVLQ